MNKRTRRRRRKKGGGLIASVKIHTEFFTVLCLILTVMVNIIPADLQVTVVLVQYFNLGAAYQGPRIGQASQITKNLEHT